VFRDIVAENDLQNIWYTTGRGCVPKCQQKQIWVILFQGNYQLPKRGEEGTSMTRSKKNAKKLDLKEVFAEQEDFLRGLI
jgi:hypothetical protein